MRKKSLKERMQELMPCVNELRDKIFDIVKTHPELFIDVESTDSQVAGFMLSICFNKRDSKVDLLAVDMSIGYCGSTSVTYKRDWMGKEKFKEVGDAIIIKRKRS